MKKTLFLYTLLISIMCVQSINAQEQNEQQTEQQIEKIYSHAEVEVEAEPIGGKRVFYNFIAENFEIDDLPLKDGRLHIMLCFVVETNGNLTNVVVENDGGFPEVAQCAIRLLSSKKCPKWKPGEVNGTPVRSSYKLPIVVMEQKRRRR